MKSRANIWTLMLFSPVFWPGTLILVWTLGWFLADISR